MVSSIKREICTFHLRLGKLTYFSVLSSLNWELLRITLLQYNSDKVLFKFLYFGIREHKQILIIENRFIVFQNIPLTLLHAFEPIVEALLPL